MMKELSLGLVFGLIIVLIWVGFRFLREKKKQLKLLKKYDAEQDLSRRGEQHSEDLKQESED